MDKVLQQMGFAIQQATIFEANGWLIILYTFMAQITIVITLIGLLLLSNQAPPEQRFWWLALLILGTLAAALATSPEKYLLTGMVLFGAISAHLERFSPETFRWRIFAGLILYAATVLGYDIYISFLNNAQATAWAQSLYNNGYQDPMLQQGISLINAMRVWGLWVFMPLGYVALLTQTLVAHPPSVQAPGQIIKTIRTRNMR